MELLREGLYYVKVSLLSRGCLLFVAGVYSQYNAEISAAYAIYRQDKCDFRLRTRNISGFSNSKEEKRMDYLRPLCEKIRRGANSSKESGKTKDTADWNHIRN